MKRLKVELVKMHRAVVMQVLEQDDATRGKGTLCDHSGLVLIANTNPALCNKFVYIRGNSRMCDFEPCARSFASDEERDVYYDKLKALIQAYNASLDPKSETGCGREVVE